MTKYDWATGMAKKKKRIVKQIFSAANRILLSIVSCGEYKGF
jgi:hypothetical protein